MNTQKRTRILILGGGFGGVYTALYLDRTLARDPNVEITLINGENFFLFTPMLHEVAASDLDVTHIVNPIRKLLRRVQFLEAAVEAIDLEVRQVVVSHGSDGHCHALRYDYLVIALGSVTNFFNLPGLAENALTMKSLGDAIHLRNHVIKTLEEADAECAAGERESMLTFVVAGGGFAGVETIAAINDLAREALAYYPHLRDDSLCMVLVHAGDVILPELGERLGRYAERKLAERGVEIRLNTRVTGVTEAGICLNDGTCLPASSTLIWTAGVSPNPLLGPLPCPRERGRVQVNAFLEVPEWPGVWALGDCACVPDSKTGKPYPPTAQHAIRQGKIAAHNITVAIHGGQKRPFVYTTLGQLASLGRRSGVANILGHNFSGFIAWWLWRTIYLSKLPRLEKKLRVALDWTLDLLFARDIVQFLTLRSTGISDAESDLHMPEMEVEEAPSAVSEAVVSRPAAR